MRKMPKDYKPLVKAALAAGWRARDGDHYLYLYPPNGGVPVTIPQTPCTRKRGLANTRAAFRRGGLDV